MVPKGWKEGKVKDLVKSLNAGVSVNSEDDGNTNSEFKILKTSCVSNGVFQPEKAKSVVESNEISRLKEPVKADSIIISRMNTPALVGANGYVENEITNSFLPDRLWQVKPRDNKVNMKWLGYWFSSSHTRYALSSTATGTSGSMKNITKPDVLNIKIDIPPLLEQQKIVKILSTWDKAISTTERLIENSTQQKKALMQQLLTGKKRLLDDEGKRFEGEWKEKTLGQYVTIKSGVSPSKFKLKSEGEVPYVKVEDMNNCSKYQIHSRNYADETKSVIFQGAVIFPKRGAAIMNNKVRIAASKLYLDSNMMALIPNKDLDSEFLYYLLLKKQLFKIADTSTIPQINNKHITPYVFKLPSLPEQQKIATVLTNADKEIELLEQQLADLQKEKKALMQQLLTGKKRVVVDGEVA